MVKKVSVVECKNLLQVGFGINNVKNLSSAFKKLVTATFGCCWPLSLCTRGMYLENVSDSIYNISEYKTTRY